MAQTKYTDGSGVAEIWANIKNYITAQLLGKANSVHTHTKSQITDFPSFGNTAGTICEGNDSRLSDARTPTSHTHTKSQITDFPSLATVATSGSYSDLSDKPTIPTKTSDLTNDSGFLTSHQDLSGYVPKSGGGVITGLSLGRTVNNSELQLCGGINFMDGASTILYGKDTGLNGMFRIRAAISGSEYTDLCGYPYGTLTWSGTPIQYISDQRYKQQITEIDDKLLDAWQDVEPVQFKYNDAVDQKGDNARLHTGYVVQQIDEACQKHNIDISEYGLYCHEEYPEETEEVEVEQADGAKTKERKVIREASEHYSLRYTEVYAVECMYLRRCIARLTARIEELEKGNNSK